MAYKNTFYINDVPVICTGGGDHDWIHANFRIEAAVNSANTGYNVDVYVQIDSEGRMNWSGNSELHVTCNDVSHSKSVKLTMYSSGSSSWDGPVSFEFDGIGVTQLKMDFDLDLTSTTGTNGKPGPTHNSDSGNLQHFSYNNYTIKIGDNGLPPVLVAPVITNLTNESPYNGDYSVSSLSNEIKISWYENGYSSSITKRHYRVNGGTWQEVTMPSVTISGLSPETTYKIEVKSVNGAGDSNILSINIRTRRADFEITLTPDTVSIDSIIFKWTSGVPLSYFEYRTNPSGDWIRLGSGTTGLISINELTPNTSYTVYFRGMSTEIYDSILSDQKSISTKTADMARITNIGDCIFGESITVTVNKTTNNLARLKVWTTGNSKQPTFEFDVNNGANTITFTQNQLDEIYKCYTTSNNVAIYFLLTTIGLWDDWEENTQHGRSLQLTGIAKTAHISVDNIPRRAQAFIGISGNTPKIAIVWVGDKDNKPRRCI